MRASLASENNPKKFNTNDVLFDGLFDSYSPQSEQNHFTNATVIINALPRNIVKA